MEHMIGFELLPGPVVVGQQEIPPLFQIYTPWVVEAFRRLLEELDALLAQPDIQFEAPLHTHTGSISADPTACKVPLVHHHHLRLRLSRRDPPGTGQSVRPGADDQHIRSFRHDFS